MDLNREKMLKEIMAIDFTLIDLNLYLDTHPFDRKAIQIYNMNAVKAKQLREAYECMYGPLSPASLSKYPWQWIESPWPWEEECP